MTEDIKIKEVTVSYAHQFNDPNESFANHRFSCSITAEVPEGANAGNIANKCQLYCENQVMQERRYLENKSKLDVELCWVEYALKDIERELDKKPEPARYQKLHEEKQKSVEYMKAVTALLNSSSRHELSKLESLPKRPKLTEVVPF